jgi:hypothetical protein
MRTCCPDELQRLQQSQGGAKRNTELGIQGVCLVCQHDDRNTKAAVDTCFLLSASPCCLLQQRPCRCGSDSPAAAWEGARGGRLCFCDDPMTTFLEPDLRVPDILI